MRTPFRDKLRGRVFVCGQHPHVANMSLHMWPTVKLSNERLPGSPSFLARQGKKREAASASRTLSELHIIGQSKAFREDGIGVGILFWVDCSTT